MFDRQAYTMSHLKPLVGSLLDCSRGLILYTESAIDIQAPALATTCSGIRCFISFWNAYVQVDQRQ